ncbi:Transmembrane nucleoporin [Vermiconidia calcicola]|uniref:Transmembrane nucleoporin n=1 Tax=Vermiconidia calcicola TaxID=1690605 RepID=A0ACC3NSJ7_9PEZI|nr:Transmembrane nucleoporin [Vermiconidia calcicola]
MAPTQANPSEPLTARLMKLAQTLQFAWFCGHVTLLLCTLRYGLSYITFNSVSRWSRFSYRTAFVAAAATYGIVVFKGYRARAKSGKGQGSPLQLLGDENVQYLAMALVWLFARQVPLALLPFTVYSIFHVATYTRGILLPTIQPPPPTPAGQKPKASALSDSIGRFVKDYYDASMSVVAGLEIALWFRILGSAILFQKGSWILLAIYTVFVRARISQSTFVQGMLRQMGARGDQLANRQDVPSAARGGWEQFKGLAAKAHDSTDPNRYMGNQAAPQKKAS